MATEREELLIRELSLANLLANVFLTLPTREDVERTLAMDPEALDDSESGCALASFIRESRDRDFEEVLLDVARDRAALVRGAGSVPVQPPYESLYAQVERTSMLESLNRFYNESGLHKVEAIHDAPDQIGVEFAFLATLIGRLLDAVEAGDDAAADSERERIDRFCSGHLYRWADLYAESVIEFAKTSYWKAIGYIILDAKALRS